MNLHVFDALKANDQATQEFKLNWKVQLRYQHFKGLFNSEMGCIQIGQYYWEI